MTKSHTDIKKHIDVHSLGQLFIPDLLAIQAHLRFIAMHRVAVSASLAGALFAVFAIAVF